jgi:hypothetical protein
LIPTFKTTSTKPDSGHKHITLPRNYKHSVPPFPAPAMNFISRFRKKQQLSHQTSTATASTRNQRKTNRKGTDTLVPSDIHVNRRNPNSRSFRRLTPTLSTSTSSSLSMYDYYSTEDDSGDDDTEEEGSSEDEGYEKNALALGQHSIATRNHQKKARDSLRKESISRLFVRVVPGALAGDKTVTGHDKLDLIRSRARSKSKSRARSKSYGGGDGRRRSTATTNSTNTMLASDRTELDALFNQADDDVLEVFQKKLTNNFEKIETEVCTTFMDWESALTNDRLKDDPVSLLQKCLGELDNNLEDAIRKLDDTLKSAYDFQTDTQNVAKELSVHFK